MTAADSFYTAGDKPLGSDGREWDIEHGATVVICPDCSGAIDAVHTDASADTYTCPWCHPGASR